MQKRKLRATIEFVELLIVDFNNCLYVLANFRIFLLTFLRENVMCTILIIFTQVLVTEQKHCFDRHGCLPFFCKSIHIANHLNDAETEICYEYSSQYVYN